MHSVMTLISAYKTAWNKILDGRYENQGGRIGLCSGNHTYTAYRNTSIACKKVVEIGKLSLLFLLLGSRDKVCNKAPSTLTSTVKGSNISSESKSNGEPPLGAARCADEREYEDDMLVYLRASRLCAFKACLR